MLESNQTRIIKIIKSIQTIIYLKKNQTHFIESDIDSEFIIIIPFDETVRIKIINVIAFDEGSAPNHMKAYINKENVNFEILDEISDQV